MRRGRIVAYWPAMRFPLHLAVAACLAAAPPTFAELVENGTFEEGIAGWRAEADEGSADLEQTDDSAAGDGALRLFSTDGPASAKAAQDLDAEPGDVLTVGATVKAAGVGYAAVAVVTPGAAESWHAVATFTDARDWRRVRGTVTVPDGATNVLLLGFFTGEGEILMDQVSVTKGEADAAGAAHPADGPDVRFVGPVGDSTLSLQLVAKQLRRPGQREVDPASVTVRPAQDHEVIAREDFGRTPGRFPEHRDAFGADGEYLGLYTVSFPEGVAYVTREFADGRALDDAMAAEPRAYVVRSGDDPAYADGRHPTAVHRKSRPIDRADPAREAGEAVVRHHLYLDLPEPMKAGATYTVELPGLNTRQASVEYAHRADAETEAVHVRLVGHRPSDPAKRAVVSLWTGTGGPFDFGDLSTFKVVDDATGEVVHEGRATKALDAGEVETIGANAESRNFAQSAVWHLDYGEVTTPGTYRVVVDGLGAGRPVEIAEDAYAAAFETVMHGLLAHRSGVALGAPFTDYERPRPMHPDDGFTVYQLDVPLQVGESAAVAASFERMLGEDLDVSALETLPGAWGGYMDAGDFDRRSQHLGVTYKLLELFESFPDYFASLRLALPPGEADNGLPDLLDEALWNLDFYRRLQRQDGGVRGGVESTSHPRNGQASWQDSLLLGAYQPDPWSSYHYAANAAKAARLVEPFDPERADAYRRTAAGAFDWAEANGDDVLERAAETSGRDLKGMRNDAQNARMTAAVELLHLTGDARYGDAFAGESALTTGGNPDSQLDATFAYAALPEGVGDGAVRSKAKAAVLAMADRAIAFQRGNSFGLTTHIPSLPMIGYIGYWSTPETAVGPVLPRAYRLGGDAKYLAAANLAANFSLGVNPLNMTYTVGLGRDELDWPGGVLHLDSRVSGQPTPRGTVVYGNVLPTDAGPHLDFAHTWFLPGNALPDSRTWPAHEFYVGLMRWPVMNEYTVHQTIGPTAYYYGFLSARK